MDNKDIRAYNILRKYKLVSLVNAMIIFKDSGINGIKRKLDEKKLNNKNNKIAISAQQIKSKNNQVTFKPFKINIVFENKDLYDESNGKYNKKDFNIFILNSTDKIEKCQNLKFEDLKTYFLSKSFIYVSNKKENVSYFLNCINITVDELEKYLEQIKGTITEIKLLSNYENKGNITAKAATFFNYLGTNYYSGGAERYLVDLNEICEELGYNFDIYQNAEKPFFKKFRNINVIGLYNPTTPLNYSEKYLNEQVDLYKAATAGKSQLHILSAFYECFPQKITPSIGISHGIAWDNPSNKNHDAISFWNSKRMFIESAMNCDKLISVDTNTANWFQTIDYELGNQKIKVIPNYVNTNEFKEDNSFKKEGKIIITYPRRLYEPRGMYLLLDIVDDLFKKYDNIEIHFVGKGFDEDVNKIKEKMIKYPDKLFCYSKEPEKMNEVYKMSDISLVPTLYSEGTSLSCLEALSTGNIVVCTRIGGLTDLIINGLNGYLVEPDKNSVLETLENIIDNIDKQGKIRKNAVETAKAFNKEIWKNRWKKELQSFNLKGKSENIGLVEFYVKDASKLSKETLKLIKEELLNKNLIYIRSDKKISKDTISNGLIQLVDYDEIIASKAIKVYLEKGLKVNREEEIIEI